MAVERRRLPCGGRFHVARERAIGIRSPQARQCLSTAAQDALVVLVVAFLWVASPPRKGEMLSFIERIVKRARTRKRSQRPRAARAALGR